VKTLCIILSAVAVAAAGWLSKPSGCCAELKRKEADLQRAKAMIKDLQSVILTEGEPKTKPQ
jgi:hypothetical protein